MPSATHIRRLFSLENSFTHFSIPFGSHCPELAAGYKMLFLSLHRFNFIAWKYTIKIFISQAIMKIFIICEKIHYDIKLIKNCGCSSMVERQLPKLNVAGSNPVVRSKCYVHHYLSHFLIPIFPRSME